MSRHRDRKIARLRPHARASHRRLRGDRVRLASTTLLATARWTSAWRWMPSAMISAPHRWHTFTGSHPLRVSTLPAGTSASAVGFAGDGDADGGERDLDDQLDPVDAAGVFGNPPNRGRWPADECGDDADDDGQPDRGCSGRQQRMPSSGIPNPIGVRIVAPVSSARARCPSSANPKRSDQRLSVGEFVTPVRHGRPLLRALWEPFSVPRRPGRRAESPAWRRSATGHRRLITPWERAALPDCGASAPGRTDRQEPNDDRTGEPALHDLLARGGQRRGARILPTAPMQVRFCAAECAPVPSEGVPGAGAEHHRLEGVYGALRGRSSTMASAQSSGLPTPRRRRGW